MITRQELESLVPHLLRTLRTCVCVCVCVYLWYSVIECNPYYVMPPPLVSHYTFLIVLLEIRRTYYDVCSISK